MQTPVLEPLERFKLFLEFFPLLSPPISLDTESHHIFSQENIPLPVELIDEFLALEEEINEEDAELIEYVPCFQIPNTNNHYIIVYWKAELMNYEYILVVYDKKGLKISQETIAGTQFIENILTHTVATIHENGLIYSIEGGADISDGLGHYDPASGNVHTFQILETGDIEQSLSPFQP